MILVQNHRLPLSGSKLVALCALLFFTVSCSPKLRELKRGGTAGDIPEKNEKPAEEGKKETMSTEASTNTRHIALLLPFELDKANASSPGLNDVKRSSLALDFYQGFKTGLDDLALKGANFSLNVLDTRDDTAENIRIASLSEVKTADLIVGPVYPTEITAFANAAKLEKTLQISPLAASRPSQANVANIVSLTASVDQHVEALAAIIVKNHRQNDAVILMEANDEDSQKFILPLNQAITSQSSGRIKPILINEASLNEASLHLVGRNIVISGSANKYTVAPLLEKLASLKDQGFGIQLYGHPNWAKLELADNFLKQLNTRITSSFYINERAENVQAFIKKYRETYHITPSEFAYKGFDAGHFFGQLLYQYGQEYAKHLTGETYHGLHNQFKFEYNPEWGYINTHVMLLGFDGSEFRPVE